MNSDAIIVSYCYKYIYYNRWLQNTKIEVYLKHANIETNK